MHITQGQFSFLPPLNDEEIRAQVDYAISNGWAVSIEWTDDPHPRNVYWNMWEQPMFEIKDGAAVIYDLEACRKACPNAYIKVNAFNSTRGVESMVMSFIVSRPAMEPGFGLIRQEGEGRTIRYTTRAYSTEMPPGSV
ncbi:MAG: ribulose 1,5-bisphosphate carboxylase small subunit [Methylotenera sp. RIFCSPLOWO2_02_FULL_45_14]|nr:MAG: ribulose 1,5-bisphosphate carboxylase small subunit [Methylotenera sp. RIFCSPLOWO2_02_FULL_45_14]